MSAPAQPVLSQRNRETVSVVARLGYAARGAIYFLVGASAAVAAIRPEHRPAGMTDALQHVQHKSFGPVVLLALVAGLVCLAGWFAAAALFRRDRTGVRGYVLSVGMLGDAAVYVGFTIIALGVMLGWWRGSGDRGFQAWTAWLLAQAYGRWLVGSIGAGLAIGGIGLGGWGLFGDIARDFSLDEDEQRVVRPMARYSLAGRGLAIALIGGYLVAAALHGDAHKAHELGGVLSTLRASHYGQAAMLFFALAFIGSALFDFLAAVYRRFDPAHP